MFKYKPAYPHHMAKDNAFMLVSLKDKGAKKLAQVISNDTCKRILELLAKKEATETELSKELGMPMSTVHYNLQNLVEAKLVNAGEYHYSEKGKEVLHYSLANKFVIIAPDNADESILNKLKSLIPAGVIAGGIAFAVKFLEIANFGFGKIAESKVGVAEAEISQKAMVLEAAAPDTALMMVEESAPAAMPAPQIAPEPTNILFYIILTIILTIIIYLAIEYAKKRLRRTKK